MAIRLRALERDDLEFVHGLTNDSKVMSYWFAEPYEALVELMEIDYIHRVAEFQIIVHPDHQGRGTRARRRCRRSTTPSPCSTCTRST